MKKITDEYANEKLEPILTKYIEDENIIELHNSILDIDPDLMSLGMFFAQRIDITKMLNTIVKDDFNIENLEKTGKELQKELENNKDLINKLSNIAEFNNPMVGKALENLTNLASENK